MNGFVPRVRVLHVEDNAQEASALRELLELGGAEVRHVSLLAEAAAACRDAHADVILLDLNLPDSRGVETLRSLNAQCPLVPIVVMTGMSDQHLVREALQSGAQDYIEKGRIGSEGLLRVLRYAVERNAAQRAIQESRSRYASILAAAPDAILTIDERGIIADANPAASRISGLPTGQLKGRKLIPGLLSSSIGELEFGELVTQPGKHLELTARGPEDVDLPVEVFLVPVESVHPRIYSCFVRDLRPRYAAEAVLRRRDEVQSGILASIPANIALLDSEGRIVHVNQAWEEFGAANGLGAPHGGLGVNYLDVCGRAVGEGEAGAAAEGISEVLQRSAASFSIVYPCHAPDQRRWFRMTVTPIAGSAGGAVVMHTNITQRILQEESLRESEERFRGTFEQAAVGMAHVSFEGKFIRVNQRFAQLHGYGIEELLQVAPEDLTPIGEAMARLQSEGVDSIGSEQRSRRRDGSFIWTRLLLAMQSSSDGLPQYVIATIEDITERKMGEERLQRLNRLHTVLSRSAEAVARMKDRQELLDRICEIAVIEGQLPLAAILLVNPLQEVVSVVALSGDANGYLENFTLSMNDSPQMMGTVGTAIRTGRVDVSNDFSSDPRMRFWRDRLASYRLQAATSFPLRSAGIPVGTLTLFAGIKDYFLEDEIRLMERVADVVSFALDALDAREAIRLQASMLDQIGQSVLATDPEGKITYANLSASQLYGWSVDEMLGRSLFELVVPDASLDQSRQIMERLRQGESWNGELNRRARDGRVFPAWITSSPIFGETGRIIGVVGVATDISPQKEVEQTLRHNQTMLAAAGRVARLGAWSFDPLSAALSWSDEVRELHEVEPGYQPDVRTAIDFYPPGSREMIEQALGACIASGQPFDLELEIVSAKGRRIFVRSIGEAVRNSAGEIVRVQGAFQDITAARRQQDDLASSLRALQMLSGSNEALIHAESEQGLLAEVCRIAVESGGYLMAWTGFPESEDGPRIQPMAFAGQESGYFSEVEFSRSPDTRWGRGPVGKTMRSGKVTIWSDLQTDPDFGPWIEAASGRGYRGAICLPLRNGSHTFGLLCLYSSVTISVSDNELALLHELADNLAFGLVSLRARREREQLEAAVRESESELRVLAESMPQMVWMTRPDGWNIYFNQRWYDYTGQTRDESQGHGWSKPFHPDDQAAAEEAWKKAVDGLADYSVEARIRRADGVYRWMLVRGEPFRDLAGRIVKWMGTCTDIDDLKQAEAHLRENAGEQRNLVGLLETERTRLVAAQRVAGVGSWETDLLTLDVMWSDETHRIFETDRFTFQPTHPQFLERVHPSDRNRMEEAFLQSMQQFVPCKIEHRLLLSGDRVKYVEEHWQVLRDKQGVPVRAIGTCQDITERREGEIALQKSEGEYRRIEEQLRQSQKMEAVGQLAAGVAHEFNNLLQALMSMATLTRLRAATPEVTKIGAEMETQIKRGATLTQQLLVFSRQSPLDKVSFDVREMIENASGLLRRLLPENIQMHLELSPDTLTIEGDAGQIQQVVLNLALNARDAMPRGGTLTMRTGGVDSDVCLEVEDTGEGMDDATRARIFEPFFTTKEVGKGTGLGLAVAYGIIEHHRGRIEVQSKVGEGTRFRILLPAVNLEPSRMPAVIEEPTGIQNGMGSVLLVEDESSVREGLTLLLEMIGYEVTAVGSAEEAMATAFGTRPDVLVTDLTLPGLNGFALGEELCQRWPTLHVILMSGYMDRSAILEARSGWQFLQKPFELTELATQLSSATEKSRQTD